MAQTTYRQLEAGDYNGVRRVALESWRSAYGKIYDDEFIRSSIDSSYSVERLRPFVAKVLAGNVFFEVAMRDGEILGFIVVVFTERGPQLSRLYVLPKCFGGRVGVMLHRHAEQFVRSYGFHYICGLVHKNNERAKRFYLSMGARHVPDLDTAEDWYVEKTLTFEER